MITSTDTLISPENNLTFEEDQRIVSAVSAIEELDEPGFIEEFVEYLKAEFESKDVISIYEQVQIMNNRHGAFFRSILLRTQMKSCGKGLNVEPDVKYKHPETFEFGEGVFVGSNAYLQGRFDGRFIVGNRSWLGPQSYYDCRALKIGSYVGIGPGVRFLGSIHSAQPVEKPIVCTELIIKPTVVDDEVDIGTGAVILPGVKIGKGAIIGAGAVVNRDIPAYSVAVGIPASVIKKRKTIPPEVKGEKYSEK